jgi:pantoate--beta-alanine ligase
MNKELKRPLAFVPTMGALHAGHDSLIKLARSRCEEVVVSIFVNPLQFENDKDLANYPRTPELDIERAENAGATYVWLPTFEEIYPDEPKLISAGKLGNLFEGVHRFGHFDGVLTVVKRLFDLVMPDFAYFGEKDYQQLFLIKKMVRDFELPIEIVAAPIIRDQDGLALSSRNIRLSNEGRSAALILSKALREGANDLELVRKILASEPKFILDYAEVIDADTFEVANSETANKRTIIAGWIEGVRLLDNS